MQWNYVHKTKGNFWSLNLIYMRLEGLQFLWYFRHSLIHALFTFPKIRCRSNFAQIWLSIATHGQVYTYVQGSPFEILTPTQWNLIDLSMANQTLVLSPNSIILPPSHCAFIPARKVSGHLLKMLLFFLYFKNFLKLELRNLELRKSGAVCILILSKCREPWRTCEEFVTAGSFTWLRVWSGNWGDCYKCYVYVWMRKRVTQGGLADIAW